MAYHGGNLIGPMPGNNPLEACTEGASAIEVFWLDRYRQVAVYPAGQSSRIRRSDYNSDLRWCTPGWR